MELSVIDRKYRDKDWLYSQYVEKKLMRSDIAQHCGVRERIDVRPLLCITDGNDENGF